MKGKTWGNKKSLMESHNKQFRHVNLSAHWKTNCKPKENVWSTRQRDGQSPSEMAVGSVEKDVGSQRHHAFMVCHARVWIGTSTVQLVSRGNAAVLQFFDKSNSYTMEKVLHADMQLSTRSTDCWSAHPYSFCHGFFWHNRISSNRSCNTVNPLISAVLW